MSKPRFFDLTKQDDSDPIARLWRNAELVRRLPPPDHHNPENFTICKSELAADIESALRDLEGQ